MLILKSIIIQYIFKNRQNPNSHIYTISNFLSAIKYNTLKIVIISC